MNRANSPFWLISAAVIALGFIATPISAQITPDVTLPNNSVVLPNGNVITIEGGTEAGVNLFHSFQDFSIPTGGEAFFNNALSIDNIITRVTGGNLSDIDGLIRANGGANLFLINPNGIQFGPNASLDIGGSFLGSTAESLLFEDGSFYSAVEANAPPLLKVNVPIGLQMGVAPGAIALQGTGYTIATEAPFIVTSLNGLRVNPENTLALVGGDITLDGAIATANSGRVELGSPREGIVGLNTTTTGWSLSYQEVNNFGSIDLRSLSLVDASGEGSGSIQVQGDNITLRDGSRFVIQNQGLTSGGTLSVIASESIEILGTNATGDLGSLILTETLGAGNTANIFIAAPQVRASQGAGITTKTYTPGRGGDITIHASESLVLSEVSPIDPSNQSNIETIGFRSGTAGDIDISSGQLIIRGQTINSTTSGSGNGGNISVSTQHLMAVDGGNISAVTFGLGQGGKVEIDARSIDLSGFNFDRFTPSALSASTVGAGNAGSLTVNTDRLRIRDGARVDSGTLASGSAGSVTVNASDSIEVTGTVPGAVNPSLIISSANIVDDSLQQFLGLPAIPSGDSGNVTVRTPRLRIAEGAAVTVRNDGTGNAGTLRLEADFIELDGRSGITASTQSGEGGNISLTVADVQLHDRSMVSAEAGSFGNGGNITFETETIALLENSSINANAFEGAGGNIQITTLGLFVAPDSRITASSQFGVDGIVTVNNPIVDPASGLVALDGDTLDPDTQVRNSCAAAVGNRFVLTGNGGLPEDPTQPIQSRTVWRDTRLGEIQSHLTPNPTETETSESAAPPAPLVEATGWRRNDRGQIELIVASGNPSHSSWQPHPECDSISQESTNPEFSIR